MKHTTITPKQFVDGGYLNRRKGKATHCFRAHLNGSAVEVEDEAGNAVEVHFACTVDNRTVTAHIPNVGYIGGWQYPHKAQPFRCLVESINEGVLYYDHCNLPTASTRH
jgi:hypothetical protein